MAVCEVWGNDYDRTLAGAITRRRSCKTVREAIPTTTSHVMLEVPDPGSPGVPEPSPPTEPQPSPPVEPQPSPPVEPDPGAPDVPTPDPKGPETAR